jgi:hypothetical protein
MARRPESDNTVHVRNIVAFHHYFCIIELLVNSHPISHPVTSTPLATHWSVSVMTL